MSLNLLWVSGTRSHRSLGMLAGVLGHLVLLVLLVRQHHARLRLRRVLGVWRRRRGLLSHRSLRDRAILLLLRWLRVVRLMHLLLQRLLRVLAVHIPLVMTGRRGHGRRRVGSVIGLQI